jgi:putative ABC transport system substrate-binding protein
MLLGGAAAWPRAAHAQQPAMPVIGFLSSGSAGAFAQFVTAFHKGLNETGFTEGQNVAMNYRWADGQYDRLPALANEFIRTRVDVIVAGGPPAAVAAKNATAIIPVVFTSGEDPVKLGLVASFNRPAGNITGVALFLDVLGGKRFGLLRELVPAATTIAVLVNPTEPTHDTQVADLQDAARAVGQQIQIIHASTAPEIDAAFATAAQLQSPAMLVGLSTFFTIQRHQLVALAVRHAIPTIYGQREFMSAGGLISYATNIADAYRQAGVYAGRILKGAKPADLPVYQPTKFELIINLNTARALGLDMPPTLLARADEVIE